MRSQIDKLMRLTGLALLAMVWIGWGMESAHAGGGGFTGISPMTISMTADTTTLPINIFNVTPNIGGPYTNTVSVKVTRNGSVLATPVNVAIVSGLSSGALYYLDGDSAHEICPTGATCPPTATVPKAYRQLAFADSTGIVTFHFSSTSSPGTVVLVASATDPVNSKVTTVYLSIDVVGGSGSTSSTPVPGAVSFIMDTAPVYIQNNPLGTTSVTQNTFKVFQVQVTDDYGQPIQQPVGHNTLKVQMMPNRPNGGEWLSTTGVDGTAQQGSEVVTGLIGGLATLSIHSGSLPGTVLIAATADRADNNVDNGIQAGITNYAMVSIGTGAINSLTFTGPFAGAVFASANNLIAVSGQCNGNDSCGNVWNGVYSRTISVIASDPYGNPPPAGTPITFRLIDSPLDMLKNRYPDQGHGQFAITGYNGDPVEGGYAFYAPNRTASRATGDTLNPFVVPNGVSWAIADPLCLLVLQDPEVINSNPSTINSLPSEGRLEYHVGSRLITGRSGNMLVVNEPFNQVSQNVGANVWYTVGCAPHKGNILNTDSNQSVVMTDDNGTASTVMNYPASQVGRRFMVTAESNGGKVGAVMTHWYLGTPDNSVLTITSPADLTQQIAALIPSPDVNPWPTLMTASAVVDVGAALTLPVTLQLLDGGVMSGGVLRRTPLPGVPISVDIVINNPSESAAIQAEEAVIAAQATLDAFEAANPGVCDQVITDVAGEPNDRDPVKCATQKTLIADLDTKTNAAVAARATANLHSPTASVSPDTVATGGGGYAKLVLNVNDLPSDGSVDFYLSTVGPDVLSETVKISVAPPAAASNTGSGG